MRINMVKIFFAILLPVALPIAFAFVTLKIITAWVEVKFDESFEYKDK